jgi:CHASE3 domain sensor protein
MKTKMKASKLTFAALLLLLAILLTVGVAKFAQVTSSAANAETEGGE